MKKSNKNCGDITAHINRFAIDVEFSIGHTNPKNLEPSEPAYKYDSIATLSAEVIHPISHEGYILKLEILTSPTEDYIYSAKIEDWRKSTGEIGRFEYSTPESVGYINRSRNQQFEGVLFAPCRLIKDLSLVLQFNSTPLVFIEAKKVNGIRQIRKIHMGTESDELLQ